MSGGDDGASGHHGASADEGTEPQEGNLVWVFMGQSFPSTYDHLGLIGERRAGSAGISDAASAAVRLAWKAEMQVQTFQCAGFRNRQQRTDALNSLSCHSSLIRQAREVQLDSIFCKGNINTLPVYRMI